MTGLSAHPPGRASPSGFMGEDGTTALVLAEFLDGWLTVLIVTIVLFTITGALALTGKRQVDQSTPPAPE